jgi:F420-dependent oxidoreductase-like protein
MKFGAWLNAANPWHDIAAEAQHVEKTGWDGIWMADHFMPLNPADALGHVQEAWTVLAALAALTSRVRLGTMVVGNTYRNPGVLAKQVAQVDIISGGRVILGLGSGWQQNEHVAYDIPFYTVGGRLRRLEESIQIIRSLFDNEKTTFAGKYYHFQDAPLMPKPVQSHLPLLVGGGGEQITLRIAARFADEWNVWGTPEVVAQKMAVLERHCEEAGRDTKTIKRSTQTLLLVTNDNEEAAKAKAASRLPLQAGSVEEIRDLIGRYRDVGVDEFIVPVFATGLSAGQTAEIRDRFIEDVAPAFR